MPSHIDVQYFLEVANTLNISRAAERLGVTQPSLSLAIQRLEHDVGTQLLVRSKSGVRLTDSGEDFALRAQKFLRDWMEIKNSALRREKYVSGLYNIGAHPSVAIYSFAPILHDLMTEFPELEIRFHHELSRKVTESVINFRVDFAVVVNPVAHPDLVIKKICVDEVGFWVAAHREYHKNVLICDDQLMQTNELMRKAQNPFERTIKSDNLEYIRHMTEQGAGVGILPERVARQHKTNDLKRLPGQWPTFSDTVALIYRRDQQSSAANQIFAKKLFELLSHNLVKSYK